MYFCTNQKCKYRGRYVSHASAMRDPRDFFPRCPGCSLVSHMTPAQTPEEPAADERAYKDFLQLQKFGREIVVDCSHCWYSILGIALHCR